MITYWKLFLIFLKIGALLIGGGYVILPIMYSEFSDKRNLVSKDEITGYFALSQSLPGIIAANISMFVGYKIHGILGSIIAIIGLTFVPFWLIVALVTVINTYTHSNILNGAFWGVGLAVIALIILTIREIWQNSNRNMFFYIIFFLTLSFLLYLKLSPLKVIIIFSILGIILKIIRRKNNDLL